MEQKVKDIMAAVFKVEPSSIDENTSPDSMDKWDSLGHMNMIVAIEEEYKIQFSDDEIAEMLNFKLVLEILRNKLNVPI